MTQNEDALNTVEGSGIKGAMLKVIGPFVISRLCIFIIAQLSVMIILKDRFYGEPKKGLMELFFRWDSGWYFSIVHNGYHFAPGEESPVAFSPLYPILIKIFSYVFRDVLLTGYIVSNVAFFFAAVYLYRIMLLETKSSETAFCTIFLMLISPVSFFFSIFYTEGLFICLIILSLYYARNKNWLAASLFGFCATLTKILGVLIVVPIVLEYFDLEFNNLKSIFKKLGHVRWDFLFILLVPMAIVAYMAYFHFAVGDALAFVHAQTAWNRKFVSFIQTWMNIAGFEPFYRWVYRVAIIISAISIGYLAVRKMRLSYVVYAVVFALMVLSSNNPECLPRYLSAVFPIHMGIGMIAARGEFLRRSIACFYLSFLTLFTILFVNGYWFT